MWRALTGLEARLDEGEQIQVEIDQRVTAGESKQGELEDKIEALEGKTSEHEWIFDASSSTPRSGLFQIKDRSMQNINDISNGYYLYLSSTDRNDNPVNLARIVEGDVLRLKSTVNDDVAELKITDHSNGQGAMIYQMIGGDMTRMFEYPYGFTLYSSFDPAGLATIDYVDERDATKLDLTGGTLTGNLTIDKRDLTLKGNNSQIFLENDSGTKKAEIHGTGLITTKDQFTATKSAGKIFVVKPNNQAETAVIYADGSIATSWTMQDNSGDDFLTPKGWVTQKLDQKLDLSGGHITGNTFIDNAHLYIKGTSARLYFKDDSGTTNATIFPSGTIDGKTIRSHAGTGSMAFEIKPDGGSNTFRVYGSGAAHSDYEVKTDSSDSALTNKKYVDSQITSKVNALRNDAVLRDEGSYTVTQEWRLRSFVKDVPKAGTNAWTYIHVGGGGSNQLGLYHMRDPTDGRHAVPRDYVDNAFFSTLQALSTAVDRAGTIEDIKEAIKGVCAERMAHFTDPSRDLPEEEWNK